MINFSGLPQNSLFGKALRLPLRAIPGDAVVRVLQGRLRGAKWIVNSGPHGYWHRSCESAKQRALAQRVLPGWTAFLT